MKTPKNKTISNKEKKDLLTKILRKAHKYNERMVRDSEVSEADKLINN